MPLFNLVSLKTILLLAFLALLPGLCSAADIVVTGIQVFDSDSNPVNALRENESPFSVEVSIRNNSAAGDTVNVSLAFLDSVSGQQALLLGPNPLLFIGPGLEETTTFSSISPASLEAEKNYWAKANVTGGAISIDDSKRSLLSITKVQRTPVPEISPLLVALLGLAVLFIAGKSRRS